MEGKAGKEESEWASPDDYLLDISKLRTRLGQHAAKIDSVSFCVSPDIEMTTADATQGWTDLAIDGVPAGGQLTMKVVAFTFSGRFAHFLRAEATANALTYPIPPRTVLLGMAGAIWGMRKDSVQEVLADAKFAVGGALPERFWHKANMRKNLPAQMPRTIKKTDKGSDKVEKNTQIPQEWLWKPSYRIWAAFAESHHGEFSERLRERRWHFSPCLGLSEMLADVVWTADIESTQLSLGRHEVSTAIDLDAASVDAQAANTGGLNVHRIRMPRDVTPDRVFTHANYVLERLGRPVPVETQNAWQAENENIMFL